MQIKDFLAEKVIYIAIATLAVISSITTIFIDINSTISIKWLLFVIWVSSTILIIALRLTVHLYLQKEDRDKIRVIKFIKQDYVYILLAKEDLSINTLLSVYKSYDGYEKLCGICLVENVQENKLIAAKLIKWKDDFPLTEQNNIVFKTSLPISVFEGFGNGQDI